MGDPLTKVVLTLLTRGVEFSSRTEIPKELDPYRVLPSKSPEDLMRYPFQTAGDDQLHVTTYDHYVRLKEHAPIFGLKVSEDKFGCFLHGTNFCEQIVVRGSFDQFPTVENNAALLDVYKTRLLTCEQKGVGND